MENRWVELVPEVGGSITFTVLYCTVMTVKTQGVYTISLSPKGFELKQINLYGTANLIRLLVMFNAAFLNRGYVLIMRFVKQSFMFVL